MVCQVLVSAVLGMVHQLSMVHQLTIQPENRRGVFCALHDLIQQHDDACYTYSEQGTLTLTALHLSHLIRHAAQVGGKHGELQPSLGSSQREDETLTPQEQMRAEASRAR